MNVFLGGPLRTVSFKRLVSCLLGLKHSSAFCHLKAEVTSCTRKDLLSIRRFTDSWLMLLPSYCSNSSNCKKTSSGRSPAHQQALHIPNRIKFWRSSRPAHTRLEFVCVRNRMWHSCGMCLYCPSTACQWMDHLARMPQGKCIAQELSHILRVHIFLLHVKDAIGSGAWPTEDRMKSLCISIFRQK